MESGKTFRFYWEQFDVIIMLWLRCYWDDVEHRLYDQIQTFLCQTLSTSTSCRDAKGWPTFMDISIIWGGSKFRFFCGKQHLNWQVLVWLSQAVFQTIQVFVYDRLRKEKSQNQKQALFLCNLLLNQGGRQSLNVRQTKWEPCWLKQVGSHFCI